MQTNMKRDLCVREHFRVLPRCTNDPDLAASVVVLNKTPTISKRLSFFVAGIDSMKMYHIAHGSVNTEIWLLFH